MRAICRSLAVQVAPKRAPGLEPRRRLAGREQPRHVDRAELLREALDPAAVHREVLVDPDVHAAADRLTVVARADDQEELVVLGLDRVLELVEVDRARLPVGEDRGDRARVLGGLELGRQQRGDRVRVGAVLGDQEVARVVPRRRRDDPGAPVRRQRRGVAAEASRRHPGAVARRLHELREQPGLLGLVHLLGMPLDADARPVRSAARPPRSRRPGRSRSPRARRRRRSRDGGSC